MVVRKKHSSINFTLVVMPSYCDYYLFHFTGFFSGPSTNNSSLKFANTVVYLDAAIWLALI